MNYYELKVIWKLAGNSLTNPCITFTDDQILEATKEYLHNPGQKCLDEIKENGDKIKAWTQQPFSEDETKALLELFITLNPEITADCNLPPVAELLAAILESLRR